MESGYRLMVGIDWATEAHPVCVLDSQGRLLEQRRVEHRAEAIAAMIDRLCPAADQPWLLALLKLAPTPTKAQRLRRCQGSQESSPPRCSPKLRSFLPNEITTPCAPSAVSRQ